LKVPYSPVGYLQLSYWRVLGYIPDLPDIISLSPQPVKTTEGHKVQTKWCLVKVSDGTRGALGKKKVYELSVNGNSFTAVWGMAEKPNRQSKTLRFSSEQGARWAAMDKIQSKLDKGYTIAYSA